MSGSVLEVIREKLAAYVDGRDDEVDAAPNIGAEELEERCRELADRLPSVKGMDELLLALAKALKHGKVTLEFIN